MSHVVSFCAPALQFNAWRDADGSVGWKGLYKGSPIKSAFPYDNGAHCLILLEPDAGFGQARFENLFLIDRDGNKVWVAALPRREDIVGENDAFVRLQIRDGEIFANTYSGYYIQFNRNTGEFLERKVTN